jgi:hypothetical protein
MSAYEQLRAVVEGCEKDVQKFYEKSNKAAGTRVRKAMQEVKSLAQQLRVDIQSSKNG